jgi:hypothetical protein
LSLTGHSVGMATDERVPILRKQQQILGLSICSNLALRTVLSDGPIRSPEPTKSVLFGG